MADPPFDAGLLTSVLLDENELSPGYPREYPLSLSLRRDEKAPGWLRLECELPEKYLLAIDNQAVLVEFLRACAERTDPSFGLIDYTDGSSFTASEHLVGRPRFFPSDGCINSREILRGYGWLTILPQELAQRLGGVEALRSTEAFYEVARLANGGVWCLATEYYRDFDEDALLEVFLAVAPVLRPGLPRLVPPEIRDRFRIIYRDAADSYNSNPDIPPLPEGPYGPLPGMTIKHRTDRAERLLAKINERGGITRMPVSPDGPMATEKDES